MLQVIPVDDTYGQQTNMLASILNSESNEYVHLPARLRVAIEFAQIDWIKHFAQYLFISVTKFQDGTSPFQLIQAIRENRYIPRKAYTPEELNDVYNFMATTIAVESPAIYQLAQARNNHRK